MAELGVACGPIGALGSNRCQRFLGLTALRSSSLSSLPQAPILWSRSHHQRRSAESLHVPHSGPVLGAGPFELEQRPYRDRAKLFATTSEEMHARQVADFGSHRKILQVGYLHKSFGNLRLSSRGFLCETFTFTRWALCAPSQQLACLQTQLPCEPSKTCSFTCLCPLTIWKS